MHLFFKILKYKPNLYYLFFIQDMHKSTKYIFWFFSLIGFTIASSTFAYKELLIENRDKHPIRVIKVILDGQHYIVTSPAEEWGDTLANLTKKVGGDTAVNGTYFCPDDYGYCGGVTHTISERVYLWDGQNRSKFWPDTSIRMVFWFTKQGNPLLVQNNLWSLQDAWLRIKSDKEKFSSLYFGLGNFPVFLYSGENVIYGYENYLDAKMKTAGNKTFICSTKDGKTIYLWVVWGINLVKMPDYLKESFDCRNAINLDAGLSIGMIYSWFVLDQWLRTRIMDAFVVLDRAQYIKLTGVTPADKTPTVSNSYTLTEADTNKVKAIYNALQPFIVKNWSKQKRSFISLLRSAVTAPVITADPQKLAIIKDLLFRLFIQDQI